jgi:hypothetical protein
MPIRLRIDPLDVPVQSTAVVAQAAQPVVQTTPRDLLQSSIRTTILGACLCAGAVAGIALLEFTCPYDHLKPTYLIGTLAGRLAGAEMDASAKAKTAYVEGVKAGELNSQIAYETKLAKVQLEKDSALAVAQQQAQLAREQAVATLQASLERTTKAYEGLYQVGIVTTQAAMTMEADLARVRATTVAQTQGARGVMANLADIVGIVGMLGGDAKLASVNGDPLRSQMTQNITSAGTEGAGAMASQILARFPNPAQFRVEQENVLQRAFSQVP